MGCPGKDLRIFELPAGGHSRIRAGGQRRAELTYKHKKRTTPPVGYFPACVVLFILSRLHCASFSNIPGSFGRLMFPLRRGGSSAAARRAALHHAPLYSWVGPRPPAPLSPAPTPGHHINKWPSENFDPRKSFIQYSKTLSEPPKVFPYFFPFADIMELYCIVSD